MINLLKRSISIVLVIVLTSSLVISVFADESEQLTDQEYDDAGERTNLNFEHGSIEDLLAPPETRSSSDKNELIYTYVQNGNTYRVYDSANSELTDTVSFIYRINENNEEELVRQENVVVEGNVITTIIMKNGFETINILDLNDQRESEFETDSLFSLYGTWNGHPVSDTYEFWKTSKPYYDIAGTTVTAVTVTINAIVRVTSLNPISTVAITSITSLVSYIIRQNIKKTYVVEDVSFSWTTIPNVTLQQKAVERTIRTFYTDKTYSTVMDTVTTIVYSQYYQD